MTELSDDFLVAYVDGQLARNQSRLIEGVARGDELTAVRVAALRAAHERLESAFEALLAGEFAALTGLVPPSHMQLIEPSQPMAPPPDPAPRRASRAAIMVSTIAALTFGMAGGYLAHDRLPPLQQHIAQVTGLQLDFGPPVAPVSVPVRATLDVSPPPQRMEAREPSWQEEAETVFSLLGRETLDVGLDTQGNADFARFQLAKVLGPGATLPDLSAEGLTFNRMQILRRDGKPLVQLLYLPAEGEPVAVFATPAEGDTDTVISLHATGTTGMASWTEAGVSYLLAGRLPEDRIVTLAKLVRRPGQAAAAPEPSRPEPASVAAPANAAGDCRKAGSDSAQHEPC